MVIYVVKLGDTIYTIAAQYGVSAAKIIEENQLTNADNLVTGQTIVILDSPTVAPTAKLGGIYTNGYAYPNIDRSILEETLPYLSYFTPFTYGFTTEGELVTIDDEELPSISREAGVAPIMMIASLTPEGTFSNELSSYLLNHEEIQDILIDNILENMRKKNYYGLDVDFEYVLREDRDLFVAFIEKTTNRLNMEGYPVFTALAPKVSDSQPGLLYEGHSYSALGRASNWILLMTYEWGYTSAQAG